MLRDGQFIREEPIRIGAHYIPNQRPKLFTPEERWAQDVILAKKPSQARLRSFFRTLLAI